MHLSLLRARLTLCVLTVLPALSFAQRPPAQPNAAEILHRMQKLNVLGSVLYIAAHPDDENTRLIAWLANGKKVRTGYLSLTRGEGGQNLIGPELGDALGIIRTQELLEARRIDGGEQFFTRAVDFGYSKSAKESFSKWGKQEVLSDVVRVIRMFRPDVIITRFPPTRDAGHGHHEASAILAREAFDLAGDPKAFPEQLEQGLQVWQPRRLFFNASTWWKENLPEIVKKDSTGEWYSVDVGGYDPLLGLSYTEIAGRSRSMHKSQGFGAAETRGEMIEYLHLEKGDKPRSKDIFEGIDMTWGRFRNGTSYQKRLISIMNGFDPVSPSTSVDGLEELRKEMSYSTKELNLAEHRISSRLQRELGELAIACIGLSLEVVYSVPRVTDINDPYEAILTNRSAGPLQTWMWPGDTIKPFSTRRCQSCMLDLGLQTEPFWLIRPHSNLYDLRSEEIGWPSTVSYASTFLSLTRNGEDLHINSPGLYKWVDRVSGERIRPVYVTPVASVIPKDRQTLLRRSTGEGTVAMEMKVEVEALTDSLTGQLAANLPAGWSTTKEIKLVNIAKRGGRQAFTFTLTQNDDRAQDELVSIVRFTFTGPKGTADRTLHEIDYPHIMPQVYYTPAEVKIIHVDARTTARTVGYIKGAGDEVPQAIEQLGVKVDMIDPSTATLASLLKYDAIVTGIRAYNTVTAMKSFNPTLMQYVAEGGTLVCQYNTLSRDMMVPDSLFGPYPFKLTRDRVTEENASCTFLTADHPLMKSPNVITAADFEGWVQERGLYFSGDLDPHYTPLLSWSDQGEDPLNGGLITCDYGKGRYIYTGISFFRQLPAGVPGAYRLFANLISKRE